MSSERETLTIGFIPLVDCAIFVAARDMGFADAEGLTLDLVRETSWANIRDRVVLGHFDAAQMLAPMPIAANLGIGGFDVPMVAPFSLGLGGNAVTVSTALVEAMAAQGATSAAGPAEMAAALAVVESAAGTIVARALVTDRQRRGSLFVPMHWTDAFAAPARVDALVGGATDPVSGQPGSKRTPVAVRPFAAAWYGFAVTAARPDHGGLAYWALAPAGGGFRAELAGTATPNDWAFFARRLLGLGEDAHVIAYHDAASGRHRFAGFDGERLVGALFTAPEPVEVSRAWAVARLAAAHTTEAERIAVLAGRGGAAAPDRGAIVCSCFDVRQIVAAVETDGCASVEAIGQLLGAGTNCGSCRSEIRRIVDGALVAQAV